MDKKEMIRIFKLTKNTILLLKDPVASKLLNEFINDRTLRDKSGMLNSIKLYECCEMLLQEETRALTDNELLELMGIGIPLKEKQELKGTVGGNRASSNIIIQKIQTGCANKLSILPEYDEFVTHINSQTF